MSARVAPWSLRSWLIVVAIALPYVVVKEAFGLAYPAWLQWAGIGIAALVGGALLISPDLLSTKSSNLARLFGAVAILAATLGAYAQFTKITVE